MDESNVEYLNPNEKQKVTYCIPIWLRDEQVKLSTNRIKNRVEAVFELTDEPIAIVAYGPSLNDTWPEIKKFKKIITCSGSHKFLIDRGIIPTWHIDVDPREHKADLIGVPHKDVEYLIASSCHPKVFDLLDGYNVKLWHVFATEEEAYRVLPPGEWALTGGSSVGLRAMAMARFLGFTNLHIFGMDGNEGSTGKHAGEHPNQPAEHMLTIYEGKTYKTTPALLECARQTFHELNQLKDVKVVFYGNGLVQEMAKNYIPKYEDGTFLAIRKPILISEEYRKLNAELHSTNPLYGAGGNKFTEVVIELCKIIGANSVLDYGCGKGLLGKSLAFPIWEYDPAIPGKDEQPRAADLVICTDVLEHIEPDKLDYVLADIRQHMIKLGYFCIHTGASTKTLSDGRNTHLTQKDFTWWLKKLSEFFKLGNPTFNGPLLEICVGHNAEHEINENSEGHDNKEIRDNN